MRFYDVRAAIFLTALSLAGCATDDTPNQSNNTNNTNNADAGADVDPTVLDLRSIAPTQGNIAGGTTVTLSGTGFDTGMTVQFGENPGQSVVVLTQRQATVVAPAAAAPGPVDVVVTVDGQTDTLPGAFTYVEAEDPQIGFCQLQAQSPATATLGQEPPALYAVVFMEGVTQGAGQGNGIEAELGWGSGDITQFTFQPMAYNVDKDGLTPGDLSNDEYGATLQIPSAGEFSYVARMRAQGRTDWVYCDLDGSENGAEQPGAIRIQEPTQPTITYCQVQNINPASATTGEDSERLYAFVYADGITTGAGQGSGIEAELGYGATGAAVDTFNYVPMGYNTDLDGQVPGDLANDEYGGRLRVSTAGQYAYAARFKTANSDWFYCDLDGNQGNGTLPVLNVTDPVMATVGYCQTQPAALAVISNTVSPAITGQVFVAGATNAAGVGSGITAELRFGPANADPTTWSGVVLPSYAGDKDGLVPGDLANDEYTAQIPGQTAGDYGYAYRFSTNGGQDWTWCDTAGSSPFDAAQGGQLTVADAFVNLPDTCKLQFPAIVANSSVGQAVTIYGRVTEANVTGVGSQNANLQAELLVGPATANPATDLAQFQKIPATLRTSGVINPGPGEDEYEANFTSTQAGDYAFAYRFSVDGGQNWSLCDLDSTTSPATFSRSKIGAVRVTTAAATPDLVDYCNIWQNSFSVSASDPAPTLTIEAFEGGLTDSGNFMAGDLEAEVGYGPVWANPALPGVFTWAALAYKGPRPGVPNNQEYEGPVYDVAPNAGSYAAAVRVRRAGSTAWSYCDTNNSTMNYFADQAAQLTVTP